MVVGLGEGEGRDEEGQAGEERDVGKRESELRKDRQEASRSTRARLSPRPTDTPFPLFSSLGPRLTGPQR